MNIIKIVIVLLVFTVSGGYVPVSAAEVNNKDSVEQVVEVMAMALNSPQVSGGLAASGKIADWTVKAKGVDLECRLTVKDPAFNIDAMSDEQWQELANKMEESLVEVMESYSAESGERLRLMRSVHTKFHFRFTDSYGNKGKITIPL